MDKRLINDLIAKAQTATFSSALAAQIISVMDLTSLNQTDNEAGIAELCAKAITPRGQVAAVCVYPQFVSRAKRCLTDTAIKVATVANFPTGEIGEQAVLAEIAKAVMDGADEIDVVMPYQAYLKNRPESVPPFLKHCKQACQRAKLKVILETGALQQAELIASASQDAIHAGADFIKTSTGKLGIGATLEAAAIMLLAIKDAKAQGRRIGFKASGGVRSPGQAACYLKLAAAIMGEEWISPDTFRFGASGLLDQVLH